MTTAAQAKQTVVTSLVFTGVLASLGDVIDRGHAIPRLRIYIGLVVAGVALTLLAGPAPELAASMAMLVVVGAVFVQADIFRKLTTIIGGSK